MISTKLYLDIRTKDKQGKYPLKYAISKKGNTAFITLGVKLFSTEWDSKLLKAKNQLTDHSVQLFKLKIDSIILNLQVEGKLKGLTSVQIKHKVLAILDETDNSLLIPFFKSYIETKENKRTQRIYKSTLVKLEQFYGTKLKFSDITHNWLDDFDDKLKNICPKINGRAVHFRNLRAVFNAARRKEIVKDYPFFGYRIKSEQTRMRDITPQQLHRLFSLQGLTDREQHFLNIAKIMFYTIGINIRDLYDNKDNIGERINYQRAKTHKLYSIKVEPEAKELLDSLRILDTYSSVHSFTIAFNRMITAIGEKAGLSNVTSYTFRYTWATIASDLDIPMETISAALGHSFGSKITATYINFNRKKIDKANRKVIDFVNSL